jgi:iron complex outermembrane receptor protein
VSAALAIVLALLAAAAPAAPGPAGGETVVTAAPQPPAAPREDQASAASVVLPDDSPTAYDDLAALMREVPGVNVVRTGSIGAASTITLRGSNSDQVRVFVDGVPVNIVAGGGVDVSTLPIGDVESVEVYRGSSPLAFGESAMGGVISITTRTPGQAHARARSGMGSFGTMFGDASAGGRLGRLRLYAGAHVLSSRGDYPYLNDNGTSLNPADDIYGPRLNNDLVQGDGVLRAALTLAGRRTLGLGVIGFTREQGLPGLGAAPSVAARFRTTRGLGYLRYESRDDLGPGGRLSSELYASLARDALDDPENETGLGGPASTHNTTRAVGGNVHAARPLGDWARAAAIVQARAEGYQPVNNAESIPVGLPARRLAGVAGAEIDLRAQRLNLDVIPSARVEVAQDVVSQRDVAGVPMPSPTVSRLLPVLRVGVVRPLAERDTLKAVVKANVGRYARAPSFIELYGNGTARILGNTDLVPERGSNADLGLWIDRAGPRVGVASRTIVFGALVDDLIQWQFASWGQARPANLARARILGVEQELRLGLGRFVRIVGQGTVLDARDRSPNTASYGNQVPFHPRYRGYARPELVHVAVGGGLELGAYADAELRAGSYRDDANLIDFGTRVLVGCGVSVAWPRAHLRLIGSAANLTGSRKEDLGDWSLPGRSVFVALAFAPVGDADAAGAPMFNPRFGP